MSLDVQVASENDKEKWNLFVDCECGSFFQYYDWKYIYEQKKGNHYIALIIRDSTDSVLGIFPVVEQTGPIYPSLSSLPEGASDGYLLKGSLSVHEQNLVVKSFLDYINNQYSQSHAYFYLRHHLPLSPESIQPSPFLKENGYQRFDNSSTKLPCAHYLKLETPFREKIWPGIGTTRMKKQIEQLKKNGISVIIDNEFEFLDDFVEMQILTVKKFGGVENSEIRENISQIFKIFRNKIKLFITLLDSKPISATLCYYTPTTAYMHKVPYYPIAIDYLTNTLPICKSIQYACEAGYQYYEMGITTTPSLAFYKEKLGGRRIPLMIYQKKFSSFKMVANKTAGSLVQGGKKMGDLIR